MAEPLVNAAPDEALAAWLAAVAAAGRGAGEPVETPLVDAQGLVVAADLVALQASPPYGVAAMDGFAVRAAEIGSPPCHLAAGSFAAIDTGQHLASGWDAVVPLEEATADPSGGLVVRAPVEIGRHVRPAGEDIPAGTVVVTAGTRLGPYETALVASCGHRSAWTRPRPRVGILRRATSCDPRAASSDRGRRPSRTG